MPESIETWNQKLKWRKAAASNAGGGCVELADLGVAMRDSKDPNGPRLYFTRSEIAAFFLGVRYGEFDYLIESTD